MELEGGMKLKLDWGKEKLEVEAEPTEEVEAFKARIYSLTRVQPDKQKLFFKGKVLKEGTLAANGLADKSVLMMMGKAESDAPSLAQQLPKEALRFQEDMTAEEQARHIKEKFGKTMPAGLENMGNTCYINSVVQVLHKLPELRQALIEHKPRGAGPGEEFAKVLGAVFEKLDTAGESFKPSQFIQSFFKKYPHFAELDESKKAFKQQDADESIQLILNDLSEVLQPQDTINKMFGFETKTSMESTEAPEDKSDPRFEFSKKLTCIIDNQMNPINQLIDGLKLGLEDHVTKHSDSLGRNAKFIKKTRLNSLPTYLMIQEVRFVWREGDKLTKTEGRKVKILRAVNFPPTLDVFDLCSDELKDKLTPVRKAKLEYEKDHKKSLEDAYESYKKTHNKSDEDNMKLYRAFKEQQTKADEELHDKRVWRPQAAQGDTGEYELVSVITHQGRSSDSGHYIAWVQNKGAAWYKYNDDEVTDQKQDHVMNLKGGGDWHIAYFLVYRKQQFLPEDKQ